MRIPLLADSGVVPPHVGLPSPASNPFGVYLETLSPGSRRTVRQSLDVVADMLTPGAAAQTFPWHEIGYQHVVEIRARLRSRYSPSTGNKVLATIRGVIRQAFVLGLIDAQRFERVRQLGAIRGVRLPRGRALSSDEIRALFGACDPETPRGARNAALLAALVGGGLRRSEVVALDLAHFDAVSSTLTISGKGNKERTSYVANEARAALDAWLRRRGQDAGPLFVPVHKGGAVVIRRMADQSVLDVVRELARKAHIPPFSPHDLRRTFVGDMLDLGVDVGSLRVLCGHASVTTTLRYDRRGEASLRRAAEIRHLPFVG
jgi:integrase